MDRGKPDKDTQIRPIWVKLSEHDSDIQNLREKIAQHGEKIARHDIKLIAMDRYVTSISQQISEVRADQREAAADIKNSIQGLDTKMDSVQITQGKYSTGIRVLEWTIGILLLIGVSPTFISMLKATWEWFGQ